MLLIKICDKKFNLTFIRFVIVWNLFLSQLFSKDEKIYITVLKTAKSWAYKKSLSSFSLENPSIKVFFSFFRSNRQTFVWTNLKRVFQLLRRYAIQLWVEGQWKWACTHNEAVCIETTRNTCKHTDNWIVWTHWKRLYRIVIALK